jgi:hypothetical protein
MMGTIIAGLIGRKIFGHVLGEKGARGIAYAGLVLVLLAFAAGIVAWLRSDAVSDHQVKVEQRAKPATDKAASERAADIIRNDKVSQERHNVIEAQPDQPIAPTSHALACKRLRDAGRDPPACR